MVFDIPIKLILGLGILPIYGFGRYLDRLSLNSLKLELGIGPHLVKQSQILKIHFKLEEL